MNERPAKPKMQSLVDYMIRHDFNSTLEEALADYRESSAGGPRLLSQQDIAARFRKVRPQVKPSNEQP